MNAIQGNGDKLYSEIVETEKQYRFWLEKVSAALEMVNEIYENAKMELAQRYGGIGRLILRTYRRRLSDGTIREYRYAVFRRLRDGKDFILHDQKYIVLLERRKKLINLHRRLKEAYEEALRYLKVYKSIARYLGVK